PRWLVFVLLAALTVGASKPMHAQASDSASGDVVVSNATTSEIPTASIDFLPASSVKTGAMPLPAGPHLPVPLNQRVLSYIDLFQGRPHDFIEGGLKRGSQSLPMIQRVFSSQGLPPDLAYVPLIESAFKPEAMSRASAKGVWQFMKGTAVENG